MHHEKSSWSWMLLLKLGRFSQRGVIRSVPLQEDPGDRTQEKPELLFDMESQEVQLYQQ